MSNQGDFIKSCDDWLLNEGPLHHSVVSTRARYARNLVHVPFAPRARKEQTKTVLERLDEAVERSRFFRNFRRITISDVNSLHRLYLKESHLLSAELEQGGEHRVLYLSPDYRIALMINEEDHLRMQCLDVGCQLTKALAILQEVEGELARYLHFAHSERFGYLTACPTNVGSGLRLSVMLHLPGLILVNKAQETLQSVMQYGLTVRGIYGEHSEHLGDLFQVSNEISLGKTDKETCDLLVNVTEQVVDREMKARDALFEQKPNVARDLLSRALAALQNAHIMDSAEALTHLSKVRLGIDRGYFSPLGHADLNRLMVDVQPAHLQCERGGQMATEQRDNIRAEMLHERLGNVRYN